MIEKRYRCELCDNYTENINDKDWKRLHWKGNSDFWLVPLNNIEASEQILCALCLDVLTRLLHPTSEII